MKSRIIVMKNIKIKIILFISIIFFAVSLLNFSNAKKTNKEVEVSVHIYQQEEIVEEEVKEVPKVEQKQAYISIPEKINGYTVIGKIEIPKIKLETYILEETNKETLNESVTKLCGPKLNGVGNFCIIGHNYNNSKMFKKLKNLEIGDTILLTDIYDQTIEYKIYDKYKVYPKQTECLEQETNGEREVTLITCTTGGIKRLILKAREIYD